MSDETRHVVHHTTCPVHEDQIAKFEARIEQLKRDWNRTKGHLEQSDKDCARVSADYRELGRLWSDACADRDALREALAGVMKSPHCEECGEIDGTDEDGCCNTCGRDVLSEVYQKAHEALAPQPTQEKQK